MRQTPVNDYLEEISTELPEEIYGRLSDAIYETTCDFDEEVGLLKAENAKMRKLCASLFRLANNECLSDTRHCDDCPMSRSKSPCNLSLDFIAMRRLGIDVTPWEVERVEVDG